MTNSSKYITLLAIFFILVIVILTGCNRQRVIKQDGELTCSTIPEWQTAQPDRGWQPNIVYYENGSMEHLSLYMKDCFESYSSSDGTYQIWDQQDCLATVGSPVLFVANIIKLPVDLVESPPWERQYSRSIYPIQQPAYILPYKTASGTK